MQSPDPKMFHRRLVTIHCTKLGYVDVDLYRSLTEITVELIESPLGEFLQLDTCASVISIEFL